MHEELMIRDAFLHTELDGLCESKAMYDAKMTNLKTTTKSPDSLELKHMKFAARKSLELGDHYRNNVVRRRLKAVGIGSIAVGVCCADGCRRRTAVGVDQIAVGV